MQQVRFWILAVVLGLVGVNRVAADGFRNPPEGAGTLGRNGASIAYGDDFAAGVHNPALLTDADSPQAGMGLTTVYGRRTIKSSLGGFTARSTDRWATIPSLAASGPLSEGPYAIGLALTSPYGRSSRFSEDSPVSLVAPYYSLLRTANINPALARRFGDQFSLGIGLNILWSDLEIRRSDMGIQSIAGPNSRMTMEGNGVGYGANAGLIWDFSTRQRLAITYRSAIDLTYKGDWRLDVIDGPTLARGDVETELAFPDVWALGYGVKATDRLRLEAKVEWVRHSRFKRMTFDAGPEAAALLGDSAEIEADWRDNWTFGVGADWQLDPQWVVRAGYQYLQTPVPSRTMIPLVAEADQSIIALGTGYARGSHRLDLAYMLGIFDRRKVEGNINPFYDGVYKFEAHLVAASYAYVF